MLTLPLANFAFWIHNIDPFAIRFSQNLGIRWYGLAYLAGFLIAWGLLNLYHKKNRCPFNSDQQLTLLTAMVIGVLVGGRLGYMFFYDLSTFLHNPFIVFKVWEGGMASHGGFIGVFVAVAWFARRTNTNFLALGDIIVTLAPPGIFLGRIANFINGFLWGKVSHVPWAVIFPHSAPGVNPQYIQPRHPSQLYAALLEGLLLFIYTQFRFWKKKPSPSSAGQLSGEFLIAYSIVRIFGEIFREPDASLILGFNRGQFFSFFLALVGLAIIIIARKKKYPSI